MEMPVGLTPSTSQVAKPNNRFDNLRVPPNVNIITNAELAKFDQVLVIVKDENKQIIGAEWAPITFAQLEANRRTLKVVNGNELADIEIHNRLGHSYDITNNDILISDTFLDANEVAALINLLNENDNFYNDLYQQAQALQTASGGVDPMMYQQFIAKLGNHIDRINKAYALPLSKLKRERKQQEIENIKKLYSELDQPASASTQDGEEEVAINRDGKNRPGAQYPELEQIDTSKLDTLSKEAFDKAFKTIKYKVKPALPKYSYNKIKGFLHLISLLVDIIPDKVDTYRRENSPINNCVSLTTIYRDVDVMNIPQLMAFAVSSVDLCTIIPHLLDLPPKALEGTDWHNPGPFSYEFFNAGLLMLVNQEIRDVTANYDIITMDSAYIIPYKIYHYYMQNTINDYSKVNPRSWKRPVASLDEVFDLVDYYSNGLIAKLDLSNSYITGSILPACLHQPKNMQAKFYIDTWYPPIYTVPANYDKYRRIVADISKVKINDHGDYIDISNGHETERLSLTEGADIDIVVSVDTEEEFELIATKHISVIQQVYGDIGVEKIQRKSGFTYEITGGHRMVQIYRSSIGSILSHHLPVVRGWITDNGSDRNVYISATAFHSLRSGNSYNYYYFAGKYNPSEVLLKYQQRGFKTRLSPFLGTLLNKYETMTAKWDQTYAKSAGRDGFEGGMPLLAASMGYGNFYLNSLWAEDALINYNKHNKLTMIQLDILKSVLNKDAYQKLINDAGTMPQKVKNRPARRFPSTNELPQLGDFPQVQPGFAPPQIPQLKPAGFMLKPSGNLDSNSNP